jgi:hypothetical protein
VRGVRGILRESSRRKAVKGTFYVRYVGQKSGEHAAEFELQIEGESSRETFTEGMLGTDRISAGLQRAGCPKHWTDLYVKQIEAAIKEQRSTVQPGIEAQLDPEEN